MPIITLTDIHKSFGPEILFSGLNHRFYANEKVGLIGANGSGKTTILRLIMGEIEPDIGKVVLRKGLRVGHVPQEPVFDGRRTLLEEMHAGLEDVLGLQKKMQASAERLTGLHRRELKSAMEDYDHLSRQFELAGGYAYETRIHTLLAGLGLGEEVYQTKTEALSGGQLSRLSIAKALLADSDLLLLDEPTNHLDLEATVWLEKFLRSYRKAVVLISHDRYLLDAVVCKIVETRDRKIITWKGNYSQYLSDKGKAELAHQRQYEQRAEMVRKTKDFIARNKDREGMRKTARGRKRRLEKLLKTDPDFLAKPVQKKKIRFKFSNRTQRSRLVLRAEAVSKAFGSLVLFEGLTFDVLAGQRLCITGPNGSGKSTLVKLALGQTEPTSGSIRMGPNLSTGYLDQHGRQLDPERTVLEEARAVRPDLSEEALRSRLGAFLFQGDDVFKKVPQLSGGQQNRLMLCRIVLSEPDVLVLDEPTNHLDVDSREVLEQVLLDYDGTIIFVSHDRYFIDKTAERLLVMGIDDFGVRSIGRFTFYSAANKVYTRYSEQTEQRLTEQRGRVQKAAKGTVRKYAKSRHVKTKAVAPSELNRFNKFSTDEIEQMITELEEEVVLLQEKFGQAGMYRQPALFLEHRTLFESKREELDLLYRVYESRIA
jgi:ATP-binding cassette subfamily F protein 3